jgi:hypothetical protein
MGLAKMKVIIFFCLVLLLASTLNGCIGPQEAVNRIDTLIVGEKEYKWKNRLAVIQEEFTILNFLSPPDEWPFFVKKDTFYLWIFIEIAFSNILNDDWDILNHGRINITLINPLGNKIMYNYATALGKSNEDKDMIFLTNPVEGQWHAEVKTFGTGSYNLRIEAYQL